jgi:peroxisomal 2,4-dienoyl-CoA reductase
MTSATTTFRPGLLEGRTALITGGGTGICRGIAEAYAALGARVCIVSRKLEVLEQTAAEIREATGAEVICAAADVRDPDAVNAAVKTAVDAFGGLDTLVCGAAGNFLAPAAVISPKGFRTVIEIDLLGTFHCCKAAFDALKAAGDGLIVNISATLQLNGTPMQGHAAAAKAGIDALTRTLAVEWGSLGIRCNAIAPGPIGDTEGMKRLAPGGLADKMAARIPMGRFGRIDEIADTAVFLRSPSAAYITGAILVVDGGESIVGPSLM